MKTKKPSRPRPIGVREQRRLKHELAKLAAMSNEVFRESVRIEIDTLGDAANLLRTTCGTLQAAIGQMQRMADACERVAQEVKRGALDPHDGFARALTALAKQVNPA